MPISNLEKYMEPMIQLDLTFRVWCLKQFKTAMSSSSKDFWLRELQKKLANFHLISWKLTKATYFPFLKMSISSTTINTDISFWTKYKKPWPFIFTKTQKPNWNGVMLWYFKQTKILKFLITHKMWDPF